jgi:pyridoxine 5-phosphate synthase
MTKLSVNINKLATLRNSRGGNKPDVLKCALDIISYGAHGITVHPRPDERHIRKTDVYKISNAINAINVEFNIEGYPSADYIMMVKEVKPAQCTLVPDPPHMLTSNAGWLIEKNFEFLKKVVADLHQAGIRTSLFVEPKTLAHKDIGLLKAIDTDRVELYTETYASHFGTEKEAETLEPYKRVAEAISKLGIELNAGHDLNLDNLQAFLTAVPGIKEVSIGHALICDALQYGMKETVSRYLSCLS